MNDDWLYYDPKSHSWIGPVTLHQLDHLASKSLINANTPCTTVGEMPDNAFPPSNIPFSQIPRIHLTFSPTIDEFLMSRDNQATTVLSGLNNSGKSLCLKHFCKRLGPTSYLVACNRIYTIDQIHYQDPDPGAYRRRHQEYIAGLGRSKNNDENNHLDFQSAITKLSNDDRNKVFSVAGDLLGAKFAVKRLNPTNDFSPFYIDINGENLRVASTGTRLLLYLLAVMLEDSYETLLFDEPEIGLSPRIQTALASFLYDDRRRQQYCPHLRRVFIATHSHIFLDHRNYSNNFVVAKHQSEATITQVGSPSSLNHLQFALLGNEPESLFLPSAILAVEGDSDATFLKSLLSLHLPRRSISIIPAHGDGEVARLLHLVSHAFGSLAESPYRDRIFIVFDSRHDAKLKTLRRLLPENHIVTWSRNGIENYYPKRIVAELFHCSIEQVSEIDFDQDMITFNEIPFSKKQLSREVSSRLTELDDLDSELATLIDRIREAI